MSGVKANWHLDALDAVGFEDPMQVGVMIDLRDEATLRRELNESVRQEASYAHTIGLECSLKWTASGDSRNPCYTCPHYTTAEDEPISLLCALGRKQNDLLDALDAHRTRPSLDEELVTFYGDMIESGAELAEALVAA